MWRLLACTISLYEEEDDGLVSWSGYVFASPEITSETVLTGGSVVAITEEGGDLAAAENPDYPGHWSLDELPAGGKVELMLEVEGAWPTAWRGVAPPDDGAWLTGTLFAADQPYWASLVEALALPVIATPADLAGEEVAHLWGSPAPGETGWDCGDIRVGGQGVRCYAADEAGAIAAVDEGTPSFFFAFDLPPGPLVVESGLGAEETYDAPAGGVVMAHWFEGRLP
jgi:hypothetical protein